MQLASRTDGLSFIERTRLLDRIKPKFLPGTLLLITGGPGSGKTVFLHQLLNALDSKAIYIDLKILSCDVTSLIRTLIKAFKGLWPEITNSDYLRDGIAYRPQNIIDQALDELLIYASEPAIIALDGCELVAERSSWWATLSVLVTRLPLFLSLILSSRQPLEFKNRSALKLHGRLLTLDSKDLYFDHVETEKFIGKNLPSATPKFIQKAHKEIFGWPAGLALICMEAQEKADKRFLDHIPSNDLLDYLQNELFAALSRDSKELLCIAACLQPFDAALLEIASVKNASESLDQILSISPLIEVSVSESGRTSCRFTSFFSDFLLDQAEDILGIKKIEELHLEAADYFNKAGEIDLALQHYVSIHKWRAVSNLILEYHVKWLEGGEYEQLTYWLNKLPHSFLREHPKLLLIQGLAYLYLGKIKEAEKALTYSFKNLKKGSRDWSEAGCRLCEVKLLNGCTRQAGELAADLVSKSRLISRYKAEAMLFEAIALHQLCHFKKCGKRWQQISAIANSKLLPLDPTTRCYLLTPKAVFYNLERSEFRESQQILDHAIAVFRASDPQKRLPWALVFKGVLKLELLQYHDAVPWFREAVHVSKSVNRSIYAISSAFMAYTLAELHQKRDAFKWLEKAEEISSQDPTLWAPAFCAIASAILHDNSKKVEGFDLAWNIATQRKMLLPQALTAYSAFVHRRFHKKRSRILLYLIEAAKTSQQWRVAHREARALIYLFLLSSEFQLDEADNYLARALQLIKRKSLDFLLTSDPNIDGLALAKHALDAGIEEDYLLDLWPKWGKHGSGMLIESFKESSQKRKIKIADIWQKTSFRPALPILSKAVRASKNKKTILQLKKCLDHISNTPPEPLFINLLGGFTLKKGDSIIPEDSWKRQTAKNLFKFLCLHYNSSFVQEQLSEIFWPDASPTQAKTNFWSAISSIRTALEPELSPRAKSNYLLLSNKTYKLNLPSGSFMDIIEFQKEARSGFHFLNAGDKTRASICFEKAIELYKGDLLPDDLYEEWCAEPREHLRLLFIKVLKALADILFAQRDIEQCIAMNQKVIHLDSWDEEAYFSIMQGYLLLGLEIKAMATYKKCEKILKSELDIEPNDKLQSLYRRIVKRRQGH